MKTSAVLMTAVDEVEFAEVDVPPPGAGEVLVQIDYSGISTGTELRCLNGQQANMPEFPFVPGYNAIGRIIEVGDGVKTPIGTKVFSATTARCNFNRCWGGHCGLHVANEKSLIPLSADLSIADALMARLASIAYRGVRLSLPQPHETVAVIGLGPIGQCSARLFHATGARVVALDRAAARVELLRAQGLEGVVVEGDLEAAGKALIPEGFDIVVDASGAAPVALTAPRLLKEHPWDSIEHGSPRYVYQGSVPGEVAFNQNDLFRREATIIMAREGKRTDYEAVLSLLQRGKISLASIVSEITSPSNAPQVYARLREAQGDYLTAGFDWSQVR